MAYFVPSNMTNIVTMAMYPILCSIQDDYVKLKRHLRCIFDWFVLFFSYNDNSCCII